MQRIVAGITTLEQHVETTQKAAEVYRPKSCPHCGLGVVHQHGHYERKADRRAVPPRLNPIPILRYRCAGCRRTCSRLPECIAPRRRFADLRVWRDLNQDGVSQASELSTLGSLGIAALNVGNTSHSTVLSNGNRIADVGTYVKTTGELGGLGETAQSAEVDLAVDTFRGKSPIISTPAASPACRTCRVPGKSEACAKRPH